ncbi:DUF4876 domain-containing protein [Gemmatimonas groenlandica]|uniref:DUF4876 domain-containing protein n=1 Tax=Gemmatimonas groenlandica TaxID=2732249 RepID=A0A6M4IPR5_9BACT|nr:DUF4876 domain-containing protein [Gemmatimonas groenlandica]QJR34271.1 DUF4876 domain-containing protein [Gemmatimonas groenlandica]
MTPAFALAGSLRGTEMPNRVGRFRASTMYAVVLTAAAALATACGGGGVADTGGGPTTPTDTTRPPTVQRASVTARVTIDPADASLAQQAGIGVDGLTVRLTSSRAGEPVRTAVTGADGTARFDNLLEGIYTASVDRALTAAELQRLPVGQREAAVFAGGGQVVLTPPASRDASIALVGARRGSVVISEIFGNYGPPGSGTNNYVYGSYLEVYNNGDTTAYLDGMLLLQASGLHSSVTSIGGPSCDQSPNSARLDSTAVYTGTIIAFPGSGQDYPIRPGEAKVMAMDAVNHMVAAPEKEQVDLSRAQFEQFWTDGDVDNPESVNMVRVYGTTAGVFGRGLPYFSGSLQHVLLSRAARPFVTPVDVPYCGASGCTPRTSARVPSEYILDLMALEYSPLTPGYAVSEAQYPRCVPWTSPFYDRAPAPLVSTIQRKAIARRSLGRTADGREILQRTRNSARDLELAEPLRRSLNK